MVLIGDTHVGKSCLLIRFAVSKNLKRLYASDEKPVNYYLSAG
jgi:GTPase SAR1 family protein